MKKAIQLVVHGKVQGVFFRVSTKHVADQLKVRGWVKNDANGTVTIEAEGDEMMVDEFINWCKTGPEEADVAWVDVKEIPVQEFQNFLIVKK